MVQYMVNTNSLFHGNEMVQYMVNRVFNIMLWVCYQSPRRPQKWILKTLHQSKLYNIIILIHIHTHMHTYPHIRVYTYTYTFWWIQLCSIIIYEMILNNNRQNKCYIYENIYILDNIRDYYQRSYWNMIFNKEMGQK